MRQGIFTLSLIAAVSLPGCTGGNASSNAVTPTEAATNSAIATTASDPSFPGEATQLVNEETNAPVEIRAEPSTQARSLATVPRDETLRAIDSTRDGEGRSRRVSNQVTDRGSTWLYMGKGWVSGEFLFQPACIRFNGNQMMVVNVSGAAVRSQPNLRAQEVKRLQGGETVVPLRKQTNGEGEWLLSRARLGQQQDAFYPGLSAEWRHDKMRQAMKPSLKSCIR